MSDRQAIIAKFADWYHRNYCPFLLKPCDHCDWRAERIVAELERLQAKHAEGN